MDVFISYKAEEFDEALWVKTTLESNDITCWMAPMSITGGASYAAEIPQAIRSCRFFVLILSEKAQRSKWIPRELDQAINENKVIMPFMIENCTLKDEFHFYLANVQRYAAYENKTNAMKKMIRDIKGILGVGVSEPVIEKKPEPVPEPAIPVMVGGGNPLQATLPQPPRKGKQKKTRIWPFVLGAAGVAAIGLVCALVVWTGHWLSAVSKKGAGAENTLSIAGKEYAVSETYIGLKGVELTAEDMDNFSKLEKLRTLSLDTCTFPGEDIGTLARPSLYYLFLPNCQLTAEQIGSLHLADLPQLTGLDLSGNKGLSSLEPLKELSDTLVTLKISNTAVSDIGLIAEFQKLETFCADNNDIRDVAGLSACSKLAEVSLNGNQLDDLTPLSSCQKLTEVYVNGNALTSLAGLETCIEIQEVQAGSNKITFLDGLTNATLLQTVFLNDNQIEDISILGKSAATLKNVYLKNNRVEDISVFRSCTALIYLNLDNNQISSLQSLADCSKLVGVSAANNQIFSLSGLEKKTGLTYLNLAYNRVSVTDGEMLSFSTKERVTVEFTGNRLTSLPLPRASSYQYIGLHDNAIRSFKNLYVVKERYLVLDYSEEIDFSALSNDECYSYKIVDCPLDKQVAVREKLKAHKTEFVSAADCANLIDAYIPDAVKGVVDYYQ